MKQTRIKDAFLTKMIIYLYFYEEKFLTEVNIIINRPIKLKIKERRKKKIF
jgi:hypothetical protein